MNSLQNYLLLSSLLFSIGLAGVLIRRNAILVLIGIELMLNAANINFIAFWRFGPDPSALTGSYSHFFPSASPRPKQQSGWLLFSLRIGIPELPT